MDIIKEINRIFDAAAPTVGKMMTEEDVKRFREIDREAFVKSHQHLDLTETKDEWNRTIFLHPHVQSLWSGWLGGRMALRQTP